MYYPKKVSSYLSNLSKLFFNLNFLLNSLSFLLSFKCVLLKCIRQELCSLNILQQILQEKVPSSSFTILICLTKVDPQSGWYSEMKIHQKQLVKSFSFRTCSMSNLVQLLALCLVPNGRLYSVFCRTGAERTAFHKEHMQTFRFPALCNSFWASSCWFLQREIQNHSCRMMFISKPAINWF